MRLMVLWCEMSINSRMVAGGVRPGGWFVFLCGGIIYAGKLSVVGEGIGTGGIFCFYQIFGGSFGFKYPCFAGIVNFHDADVAASPDEHSVLQVLRI